MIKIVIDKDKIKNIKQSIVKKIMLKRAYKGYCYYVSNSNDKKETPYSIEKFKEFDFWRIEMSFRIYFHHFKDGKFDGDYLNFKGLILNKY